MLRSVGINKRLGKGTNVKVSSDALLLSFPLIIDPWSKNSGSSKNLTLPTSNVMDTVADFDITTSGKMKQKHEHSK